MARTPGDSQAKTLKVVKLADAAVMPRKAANRPRKLRMPGLPQAILDGMTALEREHFHYFLAAFREDFPQLTPAQEISLVQAAIEYVNLLRVQAQQLETGQVISMARQHPGVQLRQWLDSLGATRKQQKTDSEGSRNEDALREALSKLSS